MRMLIYIVLTLIGLLVALIGVLGIIGSFIPPSHQASVTVEVGSPRDKVWTLLDDVQAFPTWLPQITKVEMLPDKDGHRVFRQTQGRNAFVLEETMKAEPSIVTRTITDERAMFSGSWEHKLEELPGGRTRITVTENGTVPSPIPRAMMKCFIGYHFYLNKFADALKAKCGA